MKWTEDYSNHVLSGSSQLSYVVVIAVFIGVIWMSRSTQPNDENFSPPNQAVAIDNADSVNFTKDIEPILATRCYSCHGPEKKRGGLRLDKKVAMTLGGNTGPAIVDGDIAKSNLLNRIKGLNGEKRMPMEGSPLTDSQIQQFETWIAQGAKVPAGNEGKLDEVLHWAYIAPIRTALPKVHNQSWVKNPFDQFILAKLEKEGLQPSVEADRPTLLRRLSLDLIGLPPTTSELDNFLADHSPDAYEKQVDRLLASPHYGERWARPWLDLARYADSQGYEKDALRSMWPYRDWVIKALNADMPFDQFTIEQLAGDLLPNPTIDQQIATGFHRNTMLNEEGGVDPTESLYNNVVERTGVTATVWLGSTMACAQCHNHKFDPFSQKDFYSLYAFFNSTVDEQKQVAGSENKDISPFVTVPMYDAVDIQKQLKAIQDKIGSDPTLLIPDKITAIASIAPVMRSKDQKRELTDYIAGLPLDIKPLREQELDLLYKTKAIAKSYVLQELPHPRESFIHTRGAYLSPAAPIIPATPRVLPAMPDDAPRNRLGLAKWLVDPKNPLTARVAMNRLFEWHFGKGIVATSEDLGTQSEAPTNKDLLDWLACEFIAQKWSLKAIHRIIVTSATYRQSSHVTPELLEKDPQDRLLARFPRLRLDGEFIRDQSLAVSGLLSDKMYGPGVYPYQPPGIWNNPYSGAQWMTSPGEDRFRRGIYTLWRRSAPYPTFVTFDAPSREAICTRRSRTNTALQALNLLNDPAFMQAAANLARLTITDNTGADVNTRITYAFRRVLLRLPQKVELDRLVMLFQQQLKNYQADKAAATDIVASGMDAPPASMDIPELAAYTIVCNVILNLDETINRN